MDQLCTIVCFVVSYRSFGDLYIHHVLEGLRVEPNLMNLYLWDEIMIIPALDIIIYSVLVLLKRESSYTWRHACEVESDTFFI